MVAPPLNDSHGGGPTQCSTLPAPARAYAVERAYRRGDLLDQRRLMEDWSNYLNFA